MVIMKKGPTDTLFVFQSIGPQIPNKSLTFGVRSIKLIYSSYRLSWIMSETALIPGKAATTNPVAAKVDEARYVNNVSETFLLEPNETLV
jgi:hypothetical protein